MADAVGVGAMLSLTGRFAVQGEQARRGLTLWAEEVNAAGGLVVADRGGAVPVRLRIEDDTSRVASATALAARMADRTSDEHVDLLIGPYSSVLALAVGHTAERHGRVLWNHGGSSDAIDEQGFTGVVTLLSPAGRYFVGLLDMVRATAPSMRRLAMLYGARGTFSRAVADGAAAHAEQVGFELAFTATYPAADDACADLVSRLAAARPDVILGVGTTEADLAFARALGESRAGAGVVGLVAAPIEHFRESLGSAADGIFGPSQWEPGVRHQPDVGPTSRELVERFRRRFGSVPDYPAAQAYAAGVIAQRCVELAGTLEDTALLAVARQLSLTTFYGGFRLDPIAGRQVGHDLVVVQWQGSSKRIVWPPAVAEAAPRLA